MKLLVIPSSRDLIEKLNCSVIIGIKGLSTNMPIYFDIEEVIEIVNYLKKNNREVFISLNKNMHNSDIVYLREVLVELDGLGVDGVLYYDIAVVNIKNSDGLKLDLVWAQEHLTTNYVTSNFWFENGSKYTLVSSEITVDEIIEFKEGAFGSLIVPVFGYLSMFVSRRNLVKNYLEYFKLLDSSKVNYIEKEGNVYPIINDENGTVAYSSKVLNGIKSVIDFKNIGIDYILLNSFGISNDIFIEIVGMFNSVNEDNVSLYSDKIDSMLETDRGFLDRETVYKVKNNG